MESSQVEGTSDLPRAKEQPVTKILSDFGGRGRKGGKEERRVGRRVGGARDGGREAREERGRKRGGGMVGVGGKKGEGERSDVWLQR